MKTPRNDAIELQERILLMPPAELKRLGLNKSTLWYQRKQLEAGKCVKICNKVLAKLA
jgi:CRISPR-associated protein Cas1